MYKKLQLLFLFTTFAVSYLIQIISFMRTKVNKVGYKYNLYKLLQELSVKEYSIAMKFLPRFLGVGESTFKAWIYLKEDDTRKIPGRAIILLSKYFQVHPEELYNENFQGLNSIREVSKRMNLDYE